MTATREAPPPLTPDVTVRPVNKRPRPLPKPLNIYQTAVGKKWVMAITGILMMGFVFAHMVGNLKMFLGAEDYNHYAESLRTLLYPILPKQSVLWIMRTGLVIALLVHIHAAVTLTFMNRRARPVGYQSPRDYLAANFASRTMRMSGLLVFAFIGFHLANLTLGVVGAPNFEEGQVYENVVYALEQPWVAAIYIVSNLILAVHLFHGAWSMFQSLGINNPKYNALRKYFAIGFAALVCGINITFPIAVLAGVVSV